MSQKEMTAPTPVVDQGTSEVALPAPDLSVLTDQPTEPVPVTDEKTKQDKQELTETTPASVGLVVALVVVSIVVAVVVAMWMVSPLMALLLGAGLIVVAVLAGAGWLAWRKLTRRTKNGGGRDGAGKSTNGGGKPAGGKSGGLWPFSRNTNGGGKAPAGSKPNGGGKAPAGGKPNGGSKPGGGLWPFSRNTNGGKAPAGSKPNGGGKAPNGGKPTGNSKSPNGGKPNGGSKPGGGLWPFSRNTNSGKTPAGSKPNGGGKAPSGGGKPNGGGNSNSNGGGKPAGKSKPGGGSVLLGLLARAVKDKNKTKTSGGGQADKQQSGKDDPAKGRTRQAPGGHRPETVIDVDLDDITAPGGWPGPSASGPTAPRTAPRTAPPPPFDPGPATDRSGWFDRVIPTSLRTAPHHHQAPANPYGGPEMSSTTTTTGGDIDQDAIRVANRYAGLIAKQETLMGRASACRDAADQYRRDARANQESAENHKQAARTIRDRDVAADHGRQAREAEAEAAREILAARYYEQQAETYEAEARAIGF